MQPLLTLTNHIRHAMKTSEISAATADDGKVWGWDDYLQEETLQTQDVAKLFDFTFESFQT